ncbi:MAG: hypothetical protein IJZ35_04730 [Clostridia bacterium]|nr:hypothetical protein [Clostridia bacterium]
MLKKFLKVISFLLAFVCIFSVANYALSYKYFENIYRLKTFYELEDNTVDVLALGSSHTYEGINTAVLWKEYGIAGFNLCNPAQPIWNTYYYLEEALKTQTPKVIILDTYMLYISDEYSDTGTGIQNTYGLKWSQTRIDAIKASFDMEKYGYQFFFSWLQYHSRYSDVVKSDFYQYQGNEARYKNHKGFYCYFNTTAIEDKDYTNLEELGTIPEKGEKYYRMIIELAQANNIPIIITAIPFAADSFNIKYINTAANIAEEYGVPFYNFMREYKDELALDYSTDFANKQHLNHKGNTKLTRFFADILSKEYNITDKRGDEKYSSWDDDAKVYYAQLENTTLSSLPSLGTYLSAFNTDRYKIIVTSTCSNYDELSSDAKNTASKFFSALSIDDYKNGGVWIFDGGELIWNNDMRNPDYSKSIKLGSNHTVYFCSEEKQKAITDINGEVIDTETYYANKVFINKSDKTVVAEGINICVFDTLLQEVVDTAGYNYSNDKFER